MSTLKKKYDKKTGEVEKIETINFDENGQENGTWNGYAVTKKDDPANYNFHCRDKTNADRLCECLNKNRFLKHKNIMTTNVIDYLNEWQNLIDELYEDEVKLNLLKEEYENEELRILTKTDFNKLYNANNDKVRKNHVKKELKELKELTDKKKNLELIIEDEKRTIQFLKATAYAKIELMRLQK